MYIYASLESSVFRFSTISWIEWLKHLKAGGEKSDIRRFAKQIAAWEGEMVDWEESDVNYAMEKIADRKRNRRRRTG